MIGDLIKVKVKTIWQGQVGIRDKYIKQANDEMKGLQIWCKGKAMEISANKVGSEIITRSEKPFRDKYSKEFHYLFYFNWKPEITKQTSLF